MFMGEMLSHSAYFVVFFCFLGGCDGVRANRCVRGERVGKCGGFFPKAKRNRLK